jgi:hypothetical protein
MNYRSDAIIEHEGLHVCEPHIFITKVVVRQKRPLLIFKCLHLDSKSLRFSFKEFFLCLFYCQKTAFVCEFQHTPLCKMMFFSRFHVLCV